MYYDNKSTFYFKQYGLPILTVVSCIVLIGIGSFLYWSSSTSNASKQTIVTASNELKDVNRATINILGKSLSNLKSMQTSEVGTVVDVNIDGSIIFKLNEMTITLHMIGVDSTNVSENYIQTLREDLANKEIKIAFDTEKVIGSDVYAYVYINNQLYNEQVLERGFASLRKETVNVTMYQELKQAQAYAKQLSKGIWKKK